MRAFAPMMILILGILLPGSRSFDYPVSKAQSDINEIELPIHSGESAQRLLGHRVVKKIAADFSQPRQVRDFILQTTLKQQRVIENRDPKETEPSLSSSTALDSEQATKQTAEQMAEQITDSIIRDANLHRFDPLLLLAIAFQESSLNPNAVGRHGEVGLFQIKPSTARWIAERRGWPRPTREQMQRPAINIRIGVSYLAWLRDRDAKGRLRFLNAYNQGPARVDGSHPYRHAIVNRYKVLIEDFAQLESAPEDELQIARQ